MISYNQKYSFRIIVFDHSIYLDLNMFDFISVAINWASYVIWSNKFLYPFCQTPKPWLNVCFNGVPGQNHGNPNSRSTLFAQNLVSDSVPVWFLSNQITIKARLKSKGSKWLNYFFHLRKQPFKERFHKSKWSECRFSRKWGQRHII